MKDWQAYSISLAAGLAVFGLWLLVRRLRWRTLIVFVVVGVVAVGLLGAAALGNGFMEIFVSPGYSPSDPVLTPTLTIEPSPTG